MSSRKKNKQTSSGSGDEKTQGGTVYGNILAAIDPKRYTITSDNDVAGSAPRVLKDDDELKVDFDRVANGDLARTSLQLLDGTYDLAKEVARSQGLNFTEFARRAIFYALKNPDTVFDDEVRELEKAYYMGLSESRWNRKAP